MHGQQFEEQDTTSPKVPRFATSRTSIQVRAHIQVNAAPGGLQKWCEVVSGPRVGGWLLDSFAGERQNPLERSV